MCTCPECTSEKVLSTACACRQRAGTTPSEGVAHRRVTPQRAPSRYCKSQQAGHDSGFGKSANQGGPFAVMCALAQGRKSRCRGRLRRSNHVDQGGQRETGWHRCTPPALWWRSRQRAPRTAHAQGRTSRTSHVAWVLGPVVSSENKALYRALRCETAHDRGRPSTVPARPGWSAAP